MSLFLSNKTAIITGASRGIGQAIALKLGAEGAHCILAARDSVALNGVASQIEETGGKAAYLALDLREPDAAARLVDFAVAEAGRIDIVVNNAGATKRGDFLALTDEDWADGYALKFFGSVRLCRAAWPHLKASRGSVVNIAGIGGRTPGAAFALGGSVNAALQAFTKALADTGLPDGVQVNLINPGSIRTDRLRKRLETLAKDRGVDIATAERDFVSGQSVTRIGEPADIAGLLAFLVRPEGQFLHGALIDMDGGATKTV